MFGQHEREGSERSEEPNNEEASDQGDASNKDEASDNGEESDNSKDSDQEEGSGDEESEQAPDDKEDIVSIAAPILQPGDVSSFFQLDLMLYWTFVLAKDSIWMINNNSYILFSGSNGSSPLVIMSDNARTSST